MLFAVLAATLSPRFVPAQNTPAQNTPVQNAPTALGLDGRLTVGSAIGTWELVGPFEDSDGTALRLEPNVGTVDGRTWRQVWARDGKVDFGTLLSLKAATPQTIALGNWLETDRPFDGLLLASADGALRVIVDGKLVYRRAIAHSRGNGVEPIALNLSQGRHRLVVVIETRDSRTLLSASLRQKDDGRIPTDVFVAPRRGTLSKVALEQLLDTEWNVDTTTETPTLTLKVSTKVGLPRGSAPVSVELARNPKSAPLHWDAGTWPLLALEKGPKTIHLGPIDRLGLQEVSRLRLNVGDAQFTWNVHLPESRVALLTRAAKAPLTSAKIVGGPRGDAVQATLEHLVTKVSEASFKDDAPWLELKSRALAEFLDALENPDGPFKSPGWHEVALRSTYDGRPQSVLVQVPKRYAADGSAKLPLVVVLHGYNSDPRRILQAFLDDPGPAASVDGFVIAPEAHGNTFYRGAGERATSDAIEWARETFPIDPRKISITGVSMGGTGAADLALRNSEQFSATAPLCGYQSFFVRRDTAGKPLRPWEKRLMHQFSPASLAESGHDVPLYVAHGTRDKPLENSRTLIERYQKLGYHVEQDWPDLGHAVWKKTYKNAGLFPWLTRWSKELVPKTVSLTTGLLRHSKKFWLEMTELEPTTELSHVDAAISGPSQVRVRTRAVVRFCIDKTAPLSRDAPLQAVIDNQPLPSLPPGPHCFVKRESQWSATAEGRRPEGSNKLPGIEGPWSDFLSEPVVVVYGTLDPKTAAINEWVARRLLEPKSGISLEVPVMSDSAFEKSGQLPSRAIYVGRPQDHLQFARISAKLPIQILQDRISLGDQIFPEPDVGTAFVYPDPERRVRLLGLVSANSPEGLLRVLSLPLLVPDFVVFDHGLEPAAGEVVLGRAAYVRAAGFFKSDWSLPEELLDPVKSPR